MSIGKNPRQHQFNKKTAKIRCDFSPLYNSVTLCHRNSVPILILKFFSELWVIISFHVNSGSIAESAAQKTSHFLEDSMRNSCNYRLSGNYDMAKIGSISARVLNILVLRKLRHYNYRVDFCSIIKRDLLPVIWLS